MMESSIVIRFVLLVSIHMLTGELVNIAGHGHASQSSVLHYNNFNWAADRALDGSVTYSDECQCCSITESTSPQWWELNLHHQFDISRIDVYGREPGQKFQTEGFNIYIANSTRDIANEVYDNIGNDYGDGHFIIEMQQQRGQFIYIKRNGMTHLTLCEVKVFTDNLALHKIVSMAPQFLTWKKEFATDANIRTDAAVCECCAATNLMTDPWLQVDLGDVYKISTIIIYGRSDYVGTEQHLTGMEVFVKHLSTDTGTLFYTVLNQTTVVYVTLPRYTSARYIHLILKGNSKLLVVCDIQVSPEVCPPYHYGENCENDCHCKGQTCNDTSGMCSPGGCEPGYQLPTCSIPCNDTFYGDCTEPCGNCRPSTNCNKITGYCSDCQDGYQLSSLCKTECTDGKYGYHCGESCGHCLDMSECKHIDGTCPVCLPGYQEPKCDTPCNAGTYGNCTQRCGSCKTSCDKTNGYCDDCKDGYIFPLCQKECADGTYGYRCLQNCGNCSDMSECNDVDGTCPDCQPGYQGHKCDTPCHDGYYGDCIQQCGECRTTTTCNQTTGYCDDCKDGYIFPLCQSGCPIGTYSHYCTKHCAKCAELMECSNIDGTCSACLPGFHGSKCDTPCPDGRFGFNCSIKCGQCVGNDVCDKINGTCPLGCLDTFKPPECYFHECSIYTYGFNCSNKCGQCKDDSTCDEVTGVCPSGCIEDYTGSLCTTRTDSNSDNIVISAVGCASTVVVIVICVAIGAFCYLKRKKTRKEKAEQRNNYTDLKVFATPLEESQYATIKPDEVEHRYENVKTTSEGNKSNSKFLCGCICEGH